MLEFADYKTIKYRKFTLTPFLDREAGDYGVDIKDNTTGDALDSVVAAESKGEAVKYAKEVCDNKRHFEKDLIIV